MPLVFPFIIDLVIPYVGENINHTLTRGERWAQRPFNDVLTVLMRCALAFQVVKYLRLVHHWHKDVAISLLDANARQLYWPRLVVDFCRYKLLTILGLGRWAYFGGKAFISWIKAPANNLQILTFFLVESVISQ